MQAGERNSKVVITGMAPISTLGIGKEAFWSALLKGETAIEVIPELFERNYKFRSRHYTRLPEYRMQDYGIPAKFNYLMGESAKLAVISAKLSIEDAGYDFSGGLRNDILKEAAVIVGISIGGLQDIAQSYVGHIVGENNADLAQFGFTPFFDRMIVPTAMPNSASAWVSILFGTKGDNFTVNAACASGNYAIGEAYRRIKAGYNKVVIAGGVDCLKETHGTLMRGFDVLGTLTRSADGRPQPFSENRSGFLFSEGGACLMVLEEYERAVERGADIYAEIVGYEACSDAVSIVQIDKKAGQIKSMIRKAVADRKIDYVNTHGTGTLLNDAVELSVFLDIFGKKGEQPFLNSSKSMLGHTLGASAALEAAVCALSIKHSVLHPNVAQDPMADLNLVTSVRETEVGHALNVSYGFGGHNSAMLFKKVM